MLFTSHIIGSSVHYSRYDDHGPRKGLDHLPYDDHQNEEGLINSLTADSCDVETNRYSDRVTSHSNIVNSFAVLFINVP